MGDLTIYLHKLLPLLLSPIVLVTALVLFGLAKRRGGYVVFGLLLLWVASMPVVSGKLQRVLEGDMVRLSPASVSGADAIVVLSGMIVSIYGEYGWRSEWGDADRFFGGLELLDAGKADRIVFTGGKLPWNPQSEPEGELLKRTALRFGVSPEKISVTADVVNTEGEALAVRALLAGPDARIILVTSAFHMPRARQAFETSGLRVIPYPVDFSGRRAVFTALDVLPSAGALSKTDRFIREMIGRTYYLFRYLGASVWPG